ncbi:MAG TPA: LLM class flavin-dependent oxidoreductase [Micromonosporaceae bacterium]|nr:LLM class flavin-dependent oxidoreductase [Micromonosporaceae bacterium]
MTTLGVIFLPQLPPERLRSVANAADEAGLEELWLWEDCFLEGGIASAAAALAWTRRLRVGVGVLPVPLRNVAVAAMEIATLHRMFPARVHIGVGHGVQDWMGQVGARVESPLTLLREYLDALRALLRGEEVTTEGRYVRLDRVALDWPPLSAPAIFAAATGPRTLRLAGEAADGVILTAGTSPEQVETALGLAKSSQAVVYVHAATGPDAEPRLEAERQRQGYESMDDVSAVGSAEAIAKAVQRWADAGATTVVLQPTEDDPDPEGFVRFVATEVRPLVR